MHGFSANLVVLFVVVAVETTTVAAANQFGCKALTVQFQATSLFARAAHVANLVPVSGQDLSRRCCTDSVVLRFRLFGTRRRRQGLKRGRWRNF